MNEKIYFLPNDNREYSFDEIAALILDGHIRKSSMIWEKSLPEWIKIAQHPDFVEIFFEYDRMAQEKLKKAMGTDDESIQKREMLKMLDDVSEEKHIHLQEKNPSIFKWIAASVGIILVPIVFFAVSGYLNKPEPVKTAEKAPVIDDINIEDIRFGSGVMKIDPVKGITVKKVAKAQEDEILKEMLLEIKKEAAAEEVVAQPEKKQAGLFDKVSDEELDAFRNSFMKKVESKNVSASVSKESKLAQGGEELTSKQINETVKNNYGSIKFCYDKALKNNEGISGKMEITIHIMGNGSVAKVINETPKFKGTEMDRCVTEQIKKKWVFPKFNGTLSTVTIPFILSAQ